MIVASTAIIGALASCYNRGEPMFLDLNGDGKSDSIQVVTSGFPGFYKNYLDIRLSTEQSSIERLTKINLPAGLVVELDIKDVNTDGIPDIRYLADVGTAEKSDYRSYVRYGNGNGRFTEEKLLARSDKLFKLKN